MQTTTLRQEEYFEASPMAFYRAFMDADTHAEITGSEARISAEVDGEFTAHGGYCHGVNLELVEGEKIVQSWTALDDSWPEGHVSKITLELQRDNGMTRLLFTHEAVPSGAAKSIANGWVDYYWRPFQTYFKSTSDNDQ